MRADSDINHSVFTTSTMSAKEFSSTNLPPLALSTSPHQQQHSVSLKSSSSSSKPSVPMQPLPDETEQDMKRRIILGVIDKLRERKARPDVERISSMVARVHGMRRDNVLQILETLVDEGTVLKVEYKGSVSYRNAAKWKRGSLINSVLNSEDTSRKLLEAVKALALEKPSQTGFSPHEIVEKLNSNKSSGTSGSSGSSSEDGHRSSEYEDDADVGEGKDLNGASLERALDREASTGGLIKLASGCYYLDLDGSKRQAAILKRKKSSSLSSSSQGSPSSASQSKHGKLLTHGDQNLVAAPAAKKPRPMHPSPLKSGGYHEPLDLSLSHPISLVKSPRFPLAPQHKIPSASHGTQMMSLSPTSHIAGFRPITCAPDLIYPVQGRPGLPDPDRVSDLTKLAVLSAPAPPIRPLTKVPIRRETSLTHSQPSRASNSSCSSYQNISPNYSDALPSPVKHDIKVSPAISTKSSSESKNRVSLSDVAPSTTSKSVTKHSSSEKHKKGSKNESKTVEAPPVSKTQPPVEEEVVCDFCLSTSRANRMGVPEELLNCKDCCHQAHPSCMMYTVELANRARQSPWQCSECKTCCMCQDAGDAELMLICDACDKGYHVSCHKPPVSEKPLADAKWICSSCGGPEAVLSGCTKRDGPLFEEEENRFDASRWSIQRVQSWLTEEGFPTAAQAFKEQEIDGASLLLMKRMDVLTGVGLKLGPAVKVYERISKLQNRCRTLLQAN